MLNKIKLKGLVIVMGMGMTSLAIPTIAAEEEVTEEQLITVTGSRIKRGDVEGANPVQVITRAELVATGITNMGDLLQRIPSVAGAGENANVNDKGSGAVRVSLRGLGAERTLVLLNGRRMVGSGTGADSSVDMSSIPTSIVERIEVLKDGASAVYGSDAIAGVVNIITRNDFEGIEFNTTYDASTKNGDGETKTIDMTMGFSSNKGNVVINSYYTEIGPQWNRDRAWSAFSFSLNPDGTFRKGGSSAPPWGRFYSIDGPGGACASVTRGAANGPGQSDPSSPRTPDGEFECFDPDRDFWNFQAGNYHLSPSEKYGVFASGLYEIDDSTRFKTELSFNRRVSALKIASQSLAPLAFYGQNIPYSADNYYNITQGPRTTADSPLGANQTVEIQDWRRRLEETGSRDTFYQNDTFRVMFAVEGEVFDDWNYEAYYSFGSNSSITTALGELNFDKIELAVGPSFLDPTTGEVVCGTMAVPIPGCVSLNIFGTPFTATAATQAMADYISFKGQDVGANEQQIVSASMSGEVYELPAGMVGVAFGIESRSEKGSDSPDALVALGRTTSDRTRSPTSGSYEVSEAYIETTIPIAESLDLDLAGRYSEYTVFSNKTDTTNYKVGIRWEPPVDGLILRGTASSAFRAPSISDLFAGASNFGPVVLDPCSVNPTPFCIADGVPPGGFVPLGETLSSTRGGNEAARPEEADIFTVGLVYSPAFIEGVFITLDYWDIEITNAISTLGEQLILNSCAATGLHCDLIERTGPDVPSLYGNSNAINNRTINIGGVVSSGFDFSARYFDGDFAYGQLSVTLDTTFYDTYDVEQANGDIINNAGFFFDGARGGAGNFPEWKTNINVSLATDDWSATYAFRYVGEVEENWYVDNGTQITRMIDSQLVQDVRFTYFYSENVTTTVGMTNLFDVDPPFAQGGFSDNTDPRTYSTAGRHAYVSVKLRF
ncbi:MAG: TonB-dependent receptor [Gammaproteobacteria bacterium]|nr:MAG: TonB-dependent receptor [Gammaproteobacteria bacterium]